MTRRGGIIRQNRARRRLLALVALAVCLFTLAVSLFSLWCDFNEGEVLASAAYHSEDIYCLCSLILR